MASKKEIEKYVKIKLDEIKKKKLQQPEYSKHFDCIEDSFLREMVIDRVSQNYCNNEQGYCELYFRDFDDKSKIIPPYIKYALNKANDERRSVSEQNEEIAKHNRKIDSIYKEFCTEMLLVGNKDLAEFAQRFIENAGKL